MIVQEVLYSACNKPFLRLITRPYRKYVVTPCGHCAGCKRDILKMWSDRCTFEALTTKAPSSFVTLTYNDEHLPVDRSVSYDDFTAFRWRLRKNLKRPFKYYVSTEYGEERFRPHYHVMLFGLDPASSDVLAVAKAWCPYNDEIGFFTMDYLNPSRIRYCLKYISKADDAKLKAQYQSLGLKPLFHTMSKGIGRQYFFEHLSEIRRLNGYVSNGVIRPLPRYYEKLLSAVSDDVLLHRQDLASKSFYEGLKQYYELGICFPTVGNIAGVPENAFHNDIRERTMLHKQELLEDSRKGLYEL